MTASADGLVLYHVAPSRSSTAHWILEEIGEPYTLKTLNRKKNENHSPEYLKLNPAGKVPTLVHKGVAFHESAAICCYLADTFPKANLNIPIGHELRGKYLQWLFYGPSCLEGAISDAKIPRAPSTLDPQLIRGSLGWGDLDTVLKVVTKAVSHSEYLVGDRFTAADIVISSGLRWGMFVKALPETSEFKTYVDRMTSRSAWQRAHKKDLQLTEANS